ncbi:hypothetical protein [Mycolicibacterium vaccae]|uniref:Uncharacterized protein n=1 Tax=Mycolicibacterium vaccae ATCC 25954 TaxID=1194972 RepID=K0UWU6_MYCVA|nr:hypothetical protein [Mycolicibacterium vaccae]ANI37698.1 hypothetical protein MYVA_0430 [Mycolicibacterium vaccae 95051]EJZ09480.1 hypothetical protein MVAC_12441 [Mycolicibacterium vaccae ATCC 25954]MCV7060592.1 hypothetical protein [Mycolicibacterium vaccae]
MYLRTDSGLGEAVRTRHTAVDDAIRRARAQMKAESDRYQAAARQGHTVVKGLRYFDRLSQWAREAEFLENLKAVYENQSGVPLNYTRFPVTKTDAQGRSTRNTPWRFTPQRQQFDRSEAAGSFCLGSTRSMALRSIFGVGKPTYRTVLAALNSAILAARSDRDASAEARLLISRIVSHTADPGSLAQFNQDLAERYGVTNVKVVAVDRRRAMDALKAGAPVMADLEGGWHWVMVSRSPRGELWANDPLVDRTIRRITAAELGNRFEIVVDATTSQPIVPGNSAPYQR